MYVPVCVYVSMAAPSVPSISSIEVQLEELVSFYNKSADTGSTLMICIAYVCLSS